MTIRPHEALDGSDRAAPNRSPLRLTRRQFQVFSLVASGLQFKQVGAQLGLAKSSVGVHMEHVYRKMGVDCLPMALLEGVGYGIIAVQHHPEGFVIGRKAPEYIQH